MSLKLEIGPNDHLPDDFTLERMKAHLDLDKDQALEMTKGDDPMFSVAEVEKAFPAPVKEVDPLEQVAAPVAAPAAEATPVTPATQAATADTAPPPMPNLPDVTAAQAVVAAHVAKVDDINTRYEDGQMTREEWTQALTDQTTALATAKAEILTAAQQSTSFQQSFAAQWQPVIQAFQAQHPHLNPTTDPEMYDVWDKALYAVNTDQRYAHLGLQARAELVYDTLAPQFRALGKAFPDRARPAPAAAPATPTGPRTDPRPDPMTTLAGIANSSVPPVNDGTFAALDNMDPDAAEEVLARMTPQQRHDYLHAYGGSYYGADG